MMSLFSHWYQFLCLGILIIAVIASLWFILKRECDHKDKDKVEENERRLLVGVENESEEEEEEDHYCHLWMSRWHCVHPIWLLGLRLMALVTLVGVLLWDAYTYDWTIMFYYTEWTNTMVIFYFLIASITSAHGCWGCSKNTVVDIDEKESLKRDFEEKKSVTCNCGVSKSRRNAGLQNYIKNRPCDQKAGFWGYLMQVVYQTSAGAVVLTDIIFWGLLVPFLSVKHFHIDLLMGCMHTLNLVFLLIDTVLNSLPFPWFGITYFVLWSCIYICFQWVLHMCVFIWWPYPFLELCSPWAPLWYFSLALFHIPCYSLYSGLVKIKNSFLHKHSSAAYQQP